MLKVPNGFFEQGIRVKMNFKTNKPKDLSSFQVQFKGNIKEPGLYRLKNKNFLSFSASPVGKNPLRPQSSKEALPTESFHTEKRPLGDPKSVPPVVFLFNNRATENLKGFTL